MLSGLETSTSTLPAEWAGVLAVMEVGVTSIPTAGEPPINTLAPARKLLPLMVMEVAPSTEPDAGETDVMLGATPGPTWSFPVRLERRWCLQSA